jgi:hypothetical protein
VIARWALRGGLQNTVAVISQLQGNFSNLKCSQSVCPSCAPATSFQSGDVQIGMRCELHAATAHSLQLPAVG